MFGPKTRFARCSSRVGEGSSQPTRPPSATQSHDRAAAEGGSPPAAIFLDPSGRRWRTTRIFGIAALVVLTSGVGYLGPKVWEAPTLEGHVVGSVPSTKDLGAHPPVVGVGPLARVLRVREVNGRKIGVDPFTGKDLVTLQPTDAAQSGRAPYVIQKFGYSATARKTISMTFDDGPDPKVTPALLDVLSANKAPATFFVIGRNAAAYPGIVDRMVREGHGVGAHTLVHGDISKEPAWGAHIELVATARVLRAVTGQQVGYWRMPFEGGDDSSLQDNVAGVLRAQQLGYTFAAHDFETDDWKHETNSRESVDKIPLPNLDGNQNLTMLMHDAGGANRMRTVEYVKRLIPYARAHGYTFQTMPQVQPALLSGIHSVKPQTADYLTVAAVTVLLVWPKTMLSGLFVLAIFAVVVVGFGNAGLALIRNRRRRRVVFPGPGDIGLRTSVVLAAFNEEPVVARTIRSILRSDYPILEVIVVDDGSTDGTADEVRAVIAEDPRVILLRQPNTGKAHALNRGVEAAAGDFLVTLDADTIMRPSTVTNMMRHFALDGAERLGAVAGVVRVGNRETNVLTRWQALEYLTQIGIERSAQDALGAISIIPGACAAWRKQAILEAGGYSNITLAEDCDLALTLHHRGWKVTQDDQAIAFTEAPETVDDLLAQRTRWTYGTLQAIWKHSGMLFRRKYGMLGIFVMPNYVLSVVMPLFFLPFLATMGWLAIQEQGAGVLVEYFTLFVIAHMVIAAVAVRLMGEKYHHVLMVPVYRVVFEPLRAYLLYTSVFFAIKGGRMGWKKLVRTGSLDTATETPAQTSRLSAFHERTSPDGSTVEVLVSKEDSTLVTSGTNA
jgi:cellulose synthase/poly-beta-1,6-N-acetylglucosamine synthase-like glycosyltransferase/peptidoglycan/xylan/chitin deacetylase (PgdA/CDA1 family)